MAVQEAAFAAFHGHRDHKAVVWLAFPLAGAAESVESDLGVSGPSSSDLVQRSSACAVLALLSALSLALRAASHSRVLIVHTASYALSHLLHYCLVVQACTTTAASNDQSSPEVVARQTPAQLDTPARMASAGVGLTGNCGASYGRALIQTVTGIAQQELLAMVRDVVRGTDVLQGAAAEAQVEQVEPHGALTAEAGSPKLQGSSAGGSRGRTRERRAGLRWPRGSGREY